MTIYRTRHFEYPVNNAGGCQFIRGQFGEFKDKNYVIIGFWSFDQNIEGVILENKVQFYSTNGSRVKIDIDSLPKSLEKIGGIGKRIVARLIGDDGRLATENEEGSLMVTSMIQSIRE